MHVQRREVVQVPDDRWIGSSFSELRSRTQTRQARALSLSAAVSTGSTQGKAATSGAWPCTCAISERIGRSIGGRAGASNVISMRKCGRSPGADANSLGLSEIGREEPALLSGEGLSRELEAGGSEDVENLLPVGPAQCAAL